MWQELAQNTIQTFPFLLSAIVFGFLSFIVGLAATYFLGRMLEVVHTDRTRNFVAFIGIVTSAYLSLTVYNGALVQDYARYTWKMLVVCSFAIILYVLFGFRLYHRLDEWQTKKLGAGKRLPGEGKGRKK